MRFKKNSLLDDENMRFKKQSVLDGEGMRFKKQSLLDGEGMRFKKLMANRLHRLRKFNFRPFKVLDETSAERTEGGSSSDILEGEGMRFKRGHQEAYPYPDNEDPPLFSSSDNQYSRYYFPASGDNQSRRYYYTRKFDDQDYNESAPPYPLRNSHNPKYNQFWNRIKQIYLIYNRK